MPALLVKLHEDIRWRPITEWCDRIVPGDRVAIMDGVDATEVWFSTEAAAAKFARAFGGELVELGKEVDHAEW